MLDPIESIDIFGRQQTSRMIIDIFERPWQNCYEFPRLLFGKHHTQYIIGVRRLTDT